MTGDNVVIDQTTAAIEPSPPQPSLPVPSTPMVLLERAVASGANMDTLERLMALQERWEANEARKLYDRAMARAKAEIGTIRKNRKVTFDAKPGTRATSYLHEDLAEIARTVDEALSQHGLSYRWKTSAEPNMPIEVTCVVTHEAGHSEENTLRAGRDDSGSKNSIQAIGSTLTYLQRYTLKAALGLAASNDDDGREADEGGPISQEQLAELNKRIEEAGLKLAAFLATFEIKELKDLPAMQFNNALDRIEVYKKAKKK